MSIEYNMQVKVGYVMTWDDVVPKFTYRLEEKSHMERRWDPLTGKEVDRVKVIDEEGVELIKIDGLTFGRADDTFIVSEVLSQVFDCDATVFADGQQICFCPYAKYGRSQDNIYYGLQFGYTIPFEQLSTPEFLGELTYLKARLESRGLKPEPAEVFIQWQVF